MNRYCKLALVTALSLTTLACSNERAAEVSATEAPAYHKPSAPIQLLASPTHRAEVGDELTLNFTLQARPGQPLSVELRSDGLALISPQGKVEHTPNASGQVAIAATVRTPSPGRHYLGISATSGEGDAAMSRSFSLAVQVGAQEAEKRAGSSDPEGESVRRMPAEESTR